MRGNHFLNKKVCFSITIQLEWREAQVGFNSFHILAVIYNSSVINSIAKTVASCIGFNQIHENLWYHLD